MKTRLLLLCIFLWMASAHSQTDEPNYQNDLKIMQTKITAIENDLQQSQLTGEKLLKVEKSLKNLQYSLQKKSDIWSIKLDEQQMKLQSEIDSLQQILIAKSSQLEGTTNNLDSRMLKTEEATQQNFTQLATSLKMWKLIMIVFMAILILLIVIVFMVLRNQINNQKVEMKKLMEQQKAQLEKHIDDIKQLTDIAIKGSQKKMDEQLKTEIKGIDQKLSENQGQFQSEINTVYTKMENMLIDEQKKTIEKLNANKQLLLKSSSELKKEFDSNISSLTSLFDQLKKEHLKLEKNIANKKD